MSSGKQYLPLGILALGIMATLGASLYFFESEPVDLVSSASTKRRCNVGVVSIDRPIDTRTTSETLSSLTIAQGIRDNAKNTNHIAFVILMNSPGGSATAAEEIADAISDIEVPTVTLIRGASLSGGYWVASAADHIIALGTSAIGNIGVTGSYLELTKYNEKEGYTFRELATGPYKEVGNENRELSELDKTFLLSHLDAMFSIFRETIMRNRNLSEEQFAAVSDGKYYIAREALSLGLIDAVGGIADVKTYISEKTELPASEIVLCEPTSFE